MKKASVVTAVVMLGIGPLVLAQGGAGAGGGPGAGGRGPEMRERMNTAWQKIDKQECFKALDKDANGSVSKEEFEAADFQEIFGGALRKAMVAAGGPGGPAAAAGAEGFAKLDKNGDGKVSADEYPRGPEAFDRLLQTADKDGDRMLSKEEMTAAVEARRGQAQGGAGEGAGPRRRGQRAPRE